MFVGPGIIPLPRLALGEGGSRGANRERILSANDTRLLVMALFLVQSEQGLERPSDLIQTRHS
jgi:hypothetical protein